MRRLAERPANVWFVLRSMFAGLTMAPRRLHGEGAGMTRLFIGHRQRHAEHARRAASTAARAGSSPRGRRPTTSCRPRCPGTKEQDPADWVRAASEVIAGVLGAAGPDAAGRVAAHRHLGPAARIRAPRQGRARSSARPSSGATPSTAAECDEIIGRARRPRSARSSSWATPSCRASPPRRFSG
ncbi:MAG: hypothetical protein MZV64_43185 [Ignavibacteriales bacterium]|nr:hypothetical protein [Ignavibacteriales bacterium]